MRGIMNKIVRKRLLVIVLFMASIFICANGPAFAAYFSTVAGCDNNLDGFGGGIAYNQNGIGTGNKLPVGSIIQYIYAGADDAINAPNPSSGATTGDDIVIDTKTVGNDTVYVAFTSSPGLFMHSVSGTYISGSPKIYVRAWNGTSITSSSYYGESTLFAASTNNSPPTKVGIPNIIANKPFSSTPVPALVLTSPSSAYLGDTLDVTITGQNTNFINGTSTANFGSNITVNSLTVTGATVAKANITIKTSASTGQRDITVTTTSETANGTSLFTVNAPSIQSLNPSSGIVGWTGNVVISGTGSHFKSGTSVDLGSGITVNSVTVANSTSVTANITIEAGASTGVRNLSVASDLGIAGGEILNKSSAFTVSASTTSEPTPPPLPPAPSITVDNFDGNSGVEYYTAGEITPSHFTDTSVKYEGTASQKLSYSYPAGSSAWGGLVGAVLPQNLDLTSANGMSFWLKGDGSNNTIRLDLKESSQSPANGEVYSSPLISLSDTSWHKVSVMFNQFERNPYDNITGGNGVFDKNIKQYQWLYLGKNASSSAHYVDSLSAATIALASISAVAPLSGKQGTTYNISITGVNTNFSSSSVLSFEGNGITVNYKEAVDSTHLNALITVSSNAPIGTRNVVVSTSGEVAKKIGGFSIEANGVPSYIVDDFENTKNVVYYSAGDVKPENSTDTSTKNEGNSSLKISYSYPTGSTGWGGLVGAVLPQTMDLTLVNGISFWLKGDGSDNTVRIDLKESTTEAPANGEVYSSNDISLKDTSWRRVKIPFAQFIRNQYDEIKGGNGVFDKKISQYQFIYTGKKNSNASHYVDYLIAEVLNPPKAPLSFAGTATGTTEINWSWINDSTNENGFDLYDGDGIQKGTAQKGQNMIKETGLYPNTPYTRYVASYNDDGSSQVKSITIFTRANPPKSMKLSSTTISSVKFTWDAGIGGASGYNIYRAQDNAGQPGQWVRIKESWADNTYEDKGLSPSTKYWYGVSSLNGNNIETSISSDTAGTGIMSILTSHDTIPPEITLVTFDNKKVFEGDIISNMPVIKAVISDNFAVDASSITVEAQDIYNGSSSPKVSFEASTGVMTLAIIKPITLGDLTIKITVKDTSNNIGQYSVKLKTQSGDVSVNGDAFSYPNPFNPLSGKTKIGFNLTSSGDVSIYLFDMSGRIVMKRTVSATVGYNEVEWSGANDFGEIVGNGVYLLRITYQGRLLSKGKIWVIKK